MGDKKSLKVLPIHQKTERVSGENTKPIPAKPGSGYVVSVKKRNEQVAKGTGTKPLKVNRKTPSSVGSDIKRDTKNAIKKVKDDIIKKYTDAKESMVEVLKLYDDQD